MKLHFNAARSQLNLQETQNSDFFLDEWVLIALLVLLSAMSQMSGFVVVRWRRLLFFFFLLFTNKVKINCSLPLPLCVFFSFDLTANDLTCAPTYTYGRT